MARTLVIGEAGSTHDGSLEKAKRLIDVAKQVGCDIAKFQFWSSADRLADRRHADAYREVYRRYQVPRDWLGWLRDYCDHVGIEFAATTYLPEDVHVIAPYVQRFKVASFEARDGAFLAVHREFRQPLVISTGMLTAEEAGDLVGWNGRDALLHCVSAYPCPVDQINLAVLRSDRYAGISDHTTSPLTGAVAVGAGARIVEFHVRLQDTDPANPDFATARTPGWAQVYVGNIRQAELMLGDGEKKPQACEAAMMPFRVQP